MSIRILFTLLSFFLFGLVKSQDMNGLWVGTYEHQVPLVNRDTLGYKILKNNRNIPRDTVIIRSNMVVHIEDNNLSSISFNVNQSNLLVNSPISISGNTFSAEISDAHYKGVLSEEGLLLTSKSEYIKNEYKFEKLSGILKTKRSPILSHSLWSYSTNDEQIDLVFLNENELAVKVRTNNKVYTYPGKWSLEKLGEAYFLYTYSHFIYFDSPLCLKDITKKEITGHFRSLDEENKPFSGNIHLTKHNSIRSSKELAIIESQLVGKWNTNISFKGDSPYKKEALKDNPQHYTIEFQDNHEFEIVQYYDDLGKYKSLEPQKTIDGSWEIGLTGDYISLETGAEFKKMIFLESLKEDTLDVQLFVDPLTKDADRYLKLTLKRHIEESLSYSEE